MKETATFLDNLVSAGQKARRLRIASLLTQQELSELAGVPLEHVGWMERNLPVPLDSRRRINKALWAIKARKQDVRQL
jgi:transcriptional regulator with XRE-family HTH domain